MNCEEIHSYREGGKKANRGGGRSGYGNNKRAEFIKSSPSCEVSN